MKFQFMLFSEGWQNLMGWEQIGHNFIFNGKEDSSAPHFKGPLFGLSDSRDSEKRESGAGFEMRTMSGTQELATLWCGIQEFYFKGPRSESKSKLDLLNVDQKMPFISI